MNDNVADSFRVIAQDDHGVAAHCSYCARGGKHVAVLPLSGHDSLWLGLCAYCVLEIARALARAEGKL